MDKVLIVHRVARATQAPGPGTHRASGTASMAAAYGMCGVSIVSYVYLGPCAASEARL